MNLSNLLPVAGGLAGGALGSLIPGAGTAIGGAAGTGLGEYLRQRMEGEDTNFARIAGESALGALPGIGKMAGAARSAKAGKAALGMEQQLRKQALKELTNREKMELSQFGEHLLGNYQGKNLNGTIRTARGVGNRIGLDVTTGAPKDVASQIEALILQAENMQQGARAPFSPVEISDAARDMATSRPGRTFGTAWLDKLNQGR